MSMYCTHTGAPMTHLPPNRLPPLEFVGSVSVASATFLLFFTYGVAVLPLSYAYSFLFNKPSDAQIGIAAINFLTGFALVVASK